MLPVTIVGTNLDKITAMAWRIDRIFVPPRRLNPDVMKLLDQSHWESFKENSMLDLGDGDGERNIWMGIRTVSEKERWQRYRIFVDNSPAGIVAISPSQGRVVQPTIQITAQSNEDLSSAEFSIQNELGVKAFEEAVINDRAFDPSQRRVGKTTFQCFDIGLAGGVNVIRFRLTDRAGNVGTTEARYVLDLANDHVAPQFIVHWPREAEEVYSKTFRIRGRVDDPTAKIEARSEDGKSWNAIVERNGLFWIPGIPLDQSESTFFLVATDVAGNTTQQALLVTKSDIEITVDEPPDTEKRKKRLFITGATSNPNYPIWVNGVRATVIGNKWSAKDVPINSESGSLIIQPIAALDSEIEQWPSGGLPTLEDMGNPKKKIRRSLGSTK